MYELKWNNAHMFGLFLQTDRQRRTCWCYSNMKSRSGWNIRRMYELERDNAQMYGLSP